MDDKNELNDIILNKSDTKTNQKKILLTIATFAIILIIVVIVMNMMNSSGTDNLPKAKLSPEKTENLVTTQDDPLFEAVEVTYDKEANRALQTKADLDKLTQQIKQQIQKEDEDEAEQVVEQEIIIVQENEFESIKNKPKVQSQSKAPDPVKSAVRKGSAKRAIKIGATYIQVGSFSKYTPNKRFLSTITRSGYDYAYHRVVQQGKIVNKLLVGPFKSRADAQSALMSVRKNITPDAFIISRLK
ncbi:MAG: SPOR domain-containing protein [Epsilonproteobacteria bacterium]|nr:MAG: SPOR domain-containing protein [Campylobacterota bacterium]